MQREVAKKRKAHEKRERKRLKKEAADDPTETDAPPQPSDAEDRFSSAFSG